MASNTRCNSSTLSRDIKKKTQESGHEGQIVENSKFYRVDGEIGRFEFKTHSVVNKTVVSFNSGRDFFCQLGPKEYYKTVGFKELALIYGSIVNSYQATTNFINRCRYQIQNGTPQRTLQHNAEKEGTKIINHVVEKTKNILQNSGFTGEGKFLGNNNLHVDDTPITIADEEIMEFAKAMPSDYDVDEILNNPVPYEAAKEAVQISIDDVVVKKQNETREQPKCKEGKTKRKKLQDTIAHIKKDGKCYSLAGHNTVQVLNFIIAFIFHNQLEGNRMQFFTDGHKALNDAIFKKFSWYKNMGIILDWYHLVKKCKELLSMGLNGRDLRNQTLREIMPFLWYGLTDKAINHLTVLPAKNVKNQEKIDKLISYLEKNKTVIPCYAIRKRLGLCNSSAIGEKMNDLIVSKRQKHNGMSWSKNGSIAIASITAVHRNKESKKWFEESELEFKLAA